MFELDHSYFDLTERVIGAAIEVHRAIGPGYHEAAYEEALCIELRLRGIHHARQYETELRYKGETIGTSRLDLIIDGRLIVELEAVDQLASIHEAQLLSYLRMTGLRLGLLINFNEKTLVRGVRRIINSQAALDPPPLPLRSSASSAALR